MKEFYTNLIEQITLKVKNNCEKLGISWSTIMLMVLEMCIHFSKD